MKNHIHKILLATAITTTITGCTSSITNTINTGTNFLKDLNGTPRDSKTFITNSDDKHLASYLDSNIAKLYNFNKDSYEFNLELINVRDQLRSNEYLPILNQRFMESKIVNEYKNAVHARGNVIKTFTPGFNSFLLEKIDSKRYYRNMTSNARKIFKSSDSLPIFIEYTKENKIVSILGNINTIYANYHVSVNTSYIFYTGPKVSFIQNQISQKLFDENLVSN